MLKQIIPRKSDPEEASITQLEGYVNQPHIKDVIIEGDLTNPEYNHGDVIHAAVVNNPHNLVDGPVVETRLRDPKGRVDSEILKAQSDAYKTAVNAYLANKNLETFGQIPPPAPVDWERNQSQGGRYNVKKPENQNNSTSNN
jgi:hypothetical protein